MARQGWENALDDDMVLARSGGGGFWSGMFRWLVGLLIVGTLTAGTAYYLPLHRAHKALTEQYGVVAKRAETQEAELKRLKADLASAQGERERLQAESGQQEARQKADKDRDTKLRDVLATKLSGYMGKAHLNVVSRSEGAAVLIPPNLIRMQGTEISEAGKSTLCAITKGMSAVGPLSYRVGAFVARTDAAGNGPREQAASRATSAARALEEKCTVPATRILSAGFMQPAVSGDSALSGDVLELDVALLDPPR
jgi:hypothetical protein